PLRCFLISARYCELSPSVPRSVPRSKREEFTEFGESSPLQRVERSNDTRWRLVLLCHRGLKESKEGILRTCEPFVPFSLLLRRHCQSLHRTGKDGHFPGVFREARILRVS